MTFVVDASVVVKWYIEEPGHDVARAILAGAEPLIAPDLLLTEVANALWRKTRLEELDAGHAVQILAAVAGGLPALTPTPPLTGAALGLALDLGHPVYDCVYLALAVARDAEMVTADAAFVDRLAGTSYAARVRPLS